MKISFAAMLFGFLFEMKALVLLSVFVELGRKIAGLALVAGEQAFSSCNLVGLLLKTNFLCKT